MYFRTLLLTAAIVTLAPAQDMMPLPATVERGEGRLAIGPEFSIGLSGYREARLDAAAARLTARLSALTGIPFHAGQSAEAPALAIECKGPGEKVQTPAEDESYTLQVTPQQARMSAPTPVGALRGMETFFQLVGADPTGFSVPAVRIADKPRYAWRGLMLDSARHFFPVSAIERTLEAMSAVKLNVLHWHLSDDQGFRVESKIHQELHKAGSDGLFYTQQEIRHIIAFARDRGIRVMPEFDMPGHTTAWFAGHPELAAAPGPYRIERHWGIFDPAMDPTREEVYRFLDSVVGEMAVLFSDPYFHIGGDEVNGKQWDANPRIAEFKREHGLKSNEELQSYFSKRLLAIVTKHGKKTVGWDEILAPDLPKDAVVQSWRGPKSLADAAKRGYQGILSYGYYLDLYQPAAYHYSIDPAGAEAAGLPADAKARILGGEACIWSEFVTPVILDGRIWPRLAAIAERLWSPQEKTEVDSMYRRLTPAADRLEWYGVAARSNRRMMMERIAGPGGYHALTALAGAVEPVKEYARGDIAVRAGREYSSFTPLNRMVDAVPAESLVARQFALDVAALLAGKQAAREPVRRQLELWRDQYGQLKPAFQSSFLAAEIEPVSRTVSELATAGLDALRTLEAGTPPDTGRAAGYQKTLDKAKSESTTELLIVIVDPIAKLAGGVK